MAIKKARLLSGATGTRASKATVRKAGHFQAKYSNDRRSCVPIGAQFSNESAASTEGSARQARCAWHAFNQQGGAGRAYQVFGAGLQPLLDELSEALVG